MLKRILCTLTLLGVLYVVSGCEQPEYKSHQQTETAPKMVEQHEVVE